MPYTAKAHRFFEFVAHGGVPRKKENRDLGQSEAAVLAHEGVKPSERARKVGAALKRLK